jgi:hypothetical protein
MVLFYAPEIATYPQLPEPELQNIENASRRHCTFNRRKYVTT